MSDHAGSRWRSYQATYSSTIAQGLPVFRPCSHHLLQFYGISPGKPPTQCLASAEGDEHILALANGFRHPERLAPQGHPGLIDRQPIEFRAVHCGKTFEAIECRLLLENFGINLERTWSGEYAGAAAGRLLGRNGMRRAVGAKKEPRISRGG